MSENDEYRDSDDPALNYKAIHKLAMISMFLGLGSLLTIGYPPLIFVNIIAAVLASWSIIQIARSDRFVGSTVAKIALFLAVVSAAFCTTYVFGRSWYVHKVTHKHSLVIAHLVMDGQYAEAYEYSINPTRRQPAGTDLNAYYTMPASASKPPPGLDLFTWVAQPPISVIEADHRRGKLKFQGYGNYVISDPRSEATTCIYKYEPASPDLDASTFQMIFLRQKFGAPMGISWRLYFFDILEGPRLEEKEMRIGGPPANNEKGSAGNGK